MNFFSSFYVCQTLEFVYHSNLPPKIPTFPWKPWKILLFWMRSSVSNCNKLFPASRQLSRRIFPFPSFFRLGFMICEWESLHRHHQLAPFSSRFRINFLSSFAGIRENQKWWSWLWVYFISLNKLSLCFHLWILLQIGLLKISNIKLITLQSFYNFAFYSWQQSSHPIIIIFSLLCFRQR